MYLTQPLRTMMVPITEVLQKGRKNSVYVNRVITVNVVHKSIKKKPNEVGTDKDQ